MGVESRHFAVCDRCDKVEEIHWVEHGPDGEVLTPDDWRQLRGIAVEDVLSDFPDLCEDCVEELDEWIRNGKKSQG